MEEHTNLNLGTGLGKGKIHSLKGNFPEPEYETLQIGCEEDQKIIFRKGSITASFPDDTCSSGINTFTLVLTDDDIMNIIKFYGEYFSDL